MAAAHRMNVWETPPPGLRSRDGELTILRTWITQCREGQDVVPHDVLPLAVRARRLARRLREPVLEAWASLYGASSAYRLSRYRLSRQLASVSLTLFTRHDNRQGLAATRNMLSLIAEQRGDQASAYTHLLEALRLSREVGEGRYEGVVLGNLATLAEGLGDVATALEWALSALDRARELDDQVTVTRVLVNTAALYNTLGQHDTARRQAEQALEVAYGLGRPSLLAAAHTALGEVCHQQHDHEAARGMLETGIHLAQQTGDLRKVLSAQEHLAATLLALGHVGEAHDMTRAGLQVARQIGDHTALALLQVQLGVTLGRLGETQAARQTLTEAQALGQEHNCKAAVLAALRARSELEEVAGNFREALTYFRAYHDQDKAQFGEAQSRRAQGLLVTHEVRELQLLHAQLREANRELTWAANHDPLTSARNRRAFLEVVGGELGRLARAEVAPFSLALFDIDRFKRINDQFGHDIGDAVLRRLVETVQGQLREGDVLSRWGGEEFALFLPLTSPEEAVAVCERLRQVLEADDWRALHPELQVTASFGVTTWQGQTTPDALIQQADRALYAAKNAGRNRVHTAPAPEHPVTRRPRFAPSAARADVVWSASPAPTPPGIAGAVGEHAEGVGSGP